MEAIPLNNFAALCKKVLGTKRRKTAPKRRKTPPKRRKLNGVFLSAKSSSGLGLQL